MSLALRSTYSAVGRGITSSFLASGGTPPYVYSVLPDGAGGAINASSGLYTAPAVNYGTDIVQVEDANNDTVTSNILVGSAIELICDIIQQELGLENGQVYLWDQKINIPTDSRLYIAVSVVNCKPFGNSNKFDGSTGQSVQGINMWSNVSIDILSRSTEALNRKEEILLALASNYAERQQEANSFYIANISNGFVNLSEVDGAAIPYRFNISVALQYYVKKQGAVDYFNTFTGPEVTTEE